ncbi:cobalamin B12-binding domain-containing protein [Chloroflexota bacterium]
MGEKKRIKVLIAKPGLDGHDRGAKVVADGLRDEGMEVIYTGLRQTPEKIAETAVQQDVDVVGLSSLAGAHNYLFPRVVEMLKERGDDHILIIGGGMIPNEDIPSLKEKGVSAVFGPGTSIKIIADFIRKQVTTALNK